MNFTHLHIQKEICSFMIDFQWIDFWNMILFFPFFKSNWLVLLYLDPIQFSDMENVGEKHSKSFDSDNYVRNHSNKSSVEFLFLVKSHKYWPFLQKHGCTMRWKVFSFSSIFYQEINCKKRLKIFSTVAFTVIDLIFKKRSIINLGWKTEWKNQVE